MDPMTDFQTRHKVRAMNQPSRIAEILEILDQHKTCSIIELAQRFDVSEETIRRDVRQLENSGRAIKVHGGVRLPDNAFEAPYRIRMNDAAEAKRRIGLAAAEMVEDGMTLLIDSGTTSCWAARALQRQRNLSVVTNAIEVARDLAGNNNNRVYLAGGQIDPDYGSAFGQEALNFAKQFSTDLAFISIAALDAQQGLLDYSLAEMEFKRAILPRARKIVVLADQNKFDRGGLIHLCGFNQVHVLVTDEAPKGELKEALLAAKVQIEVAG